MQLCLEFSTEKEVHVGYFVGMSIEK